MRFSVDPDSRTSIYLQIKDQIRYAISVGELRPGDALPSIRKLETELGVNRNTIRRAYLELQNEGTLTIRQGKKAEVAASPFRPPGRASGSQAEVLARRMVEEAEAEGFDGVWFIPVFEKAAVDHDRRYAKCAFIECSQYQADDFAGATSAVWGRRVVGIDLHRLQEDIDSLPSSTQYVLTTHWHLAEVQRRLKQRVKAIQGRERPTFPDILRRRPPVERPNHGADPAGPRVRTGIPEAGPGTCGRQGRRTSGSHGRTGGPDAPGHR